MASKANISKKDERILGSQKNNYPDFIIHDSTIFDEGFIDDLEKNVVLKISDNLDDGGILGIRF